MGGHIPKTIKINVLLPDYVEQLEYEADTLTEQIAEKKLEMKKNVLAYYDDPTLEYNANRSLFEENKRLAEENKKRKQEVKKVTRERDMCEMALAISKPEEEEEDTNDGV